MIPDSKVYKTKLKYLFSFNSSIDINFTTYIFMREFRFNYCLRNSSVLLTEINNYYLNAEILLNIDYNVWATFLIKGSLDTVLHEAIKKKISNS